MAKGGRARQDSSASQMSAMILSASVLIWCGETCTKRIPFAPIRRDRLIVRCQSSGDRCHSRDSTSTATPASGHHAAGTARRSRPIYSRALNIGAGNPAAWIRLRRSPSAADRTPSATSASVRRSQADWRTGPCRSSSAN